MAATRIHRSRSWAAAARARRAARRRARPARATSTTGAAPTTKAAEAAAVATARSSTRRANRRARRAPRSRAVSDRPSLSRPLAHQSFLRRARHEAAGAIEEATADDTARPGRAGALDVVEQPVIDAEGAVKPDGVVDACDLHSGRHEADAVGVERGAEEREVRDIGQQVPVQRRVIGQAVDHAVPEPARGSVHRGSERIARLDGPDLDGPGHRGARPHELGQELGELEGELRFGAERLGRRHRGHRVLVLEARLVDLERRGQAEDRLALLHADDAPGGKALAVAQPVYLVKDGRLHFARADEVPVRGVHGAPWLHGLRRGRQRLPEDLSAEDGPPAEVLAVAAKEIAVDALEGEEVDEVLEDGLHSQGS